MKQVSHRASRTLIALAALLSFLGLGNIWFASQKITTYQELLNQNTADERAPTPTFAGNLLTPGDSGATYSNHEGRPISRHPSTQRSLISADRNFAMQQAHRQRLQAQMDFYRFVETGGKCFILLAGVALLGAGLLNRRSDEALDTEL